jgi:hypothetical protein
MSEFSPQQIADREAITDKIYRYCRSVDRLDRAVGYSVFHEDSYADFGDNYRGAGRGWIDCVLKQHLDFLHHSHQVTNIILEVNGDTAGSESYVYASLQRQDGDKRFQHEFWARYIDKWSKRNGEWAIDRRDCIVDYGVQREVTPLWTDPRSKRDAGDPSYTVLASAG